MSDQGPRWEPVCGLDEIPPNGKRLVGVQTGPHGATRPEKLLVVRQDDGGVSVVDGRCPHEGYPLSDGVLDGCVLTCAWHNWKFDLRTGDSTLGGEGVRRWPSRVVEGQIEVELTGPDPAASVAERFDSLTAALAEGRMGRGLRECLRLLVAGVPAPEVCAHIARHDALYAEWGTTHALPVAVDCARLAAELDDPYEALHRLAPAVDMAVDACARLPLRPRPEPAAVDAARVAIEAADGGDLLVAAIEAEDARGAEAIVRAAGGAAVVEAWLLRCVALHFSDFGHQLIYLQKLRELRALLGDGPAPLMADLHAGLVVSLAYATREDTLPYMRKWFRGDAPAPDGPVREAADALIVAGARRLEWFDETIADDFTIEEDWLSATHRFTAALAIAELLDHVPCSDRDARALLRQGGAFVALGEATDRSEAPPRHPVTAGWRDPLLDELLDDRFVRPIRLAHGVKTLVAAMDAAARLPADLADAPVHAVRRFFGTPSRQRRLRNQVEAAVRWLRDGKPPRRLTQ